MAGSGMTPDLAHSAQWSFVTIDVCNETRTESYIMRIKELHLYYHFFFLEKNYVYRMRARISQQMKLFSRTQ